LTTAAEGPRLVERARGPFAGSTFRWLNPVGVADFDGDGQLDLASVVTPHIGGVLQLLHYRPPALVPFASALDVSNHRMGALEQELAVIVQQPGQRPTIVLPDMTRRALHALRWDAPGKWTELADLKPLPGLVERLTPLPQGACATLADGRSCGSRCRTRPRNFGRKAQCRSTCRMVAASSRPQTWPRRRRPPRSSHGLRWRCRSATNGSPPGWT
jgi:hypothetical protein